MNDDIAALKSQVDELTRRLTYFETYFTPAPPPAPIIPTEFNFSGLERNWQKKHLAWQAVLVATVRETYETLGFRDNIAGRLTRTGPGAGAIGVAINYVDPQALVDDVPRSIAAELTGETQCQQYVNEHDLFRPQMQVSREGEHPDVKGARLKAELAIRQQHTRELLRATVGKLPAVPDALRQAIARINENRG